MLILVARVLGTEMFGRYSYILTFLSLATILAQFGTNSVLAKDIAQACGEDARAYWGTYLLLRLGLSLLVMIPAAAAAWLLREDLFICLLTGCLAIPFLASRFFEPVYQVYNRPWYSLYTLALYGAVYAACAGAALIAARALYPVVLVYAASNVVYAAAALALSLRLVKPALKPGWSKIKAIMRLSFPIGISDIFILLNTRADIFMLAWMQSDYAVGIYNAAFRFFDMAVILALTAMNPIIPVFSRLAACDRGRLKRRFTELIELIAVFCVPAAVLAPHVSPAIMRLFFGEPFAASADVLNILAWVSVVVFYSLFGSALCLSIGVVNYKYWSAPAAAALNIFINYLLIPRYSFIGSAWATLICEIFLAGATFFFIIRNLGSVFRWRRWLRIAAANAVLFAAAALMRPLPAAPALAGAVFIYAVTCFVLGILSRDAVRRAAGLFNRSGGA